VLKPKNLNFPIGLVFTLGKGVPKVLNLRANIWFSHFQNFFERFGELWDFPGGKVSLFYLEFSGIPLFWGFGAWEFPHLRKGKGNF